MERDAALAPGYLRSEVERLRFGVFMPEEEPARAVAGAEPGPFAASLLQGQAAGVIEAGNPTTIREGFPASILERETGFEPATLSLGS